MSTINEVIERVQRTKPNSMDSREKARVLLELDRRIYEEITAADEPERLPPMAWPEDEDAQLVVRSPYDNLYDLYLTAMVEFWMREYEEYNNTVDQFQQAYNEFRSRWRRDHRPKGNPSWNVMR